MFLVSYGFNLVLTAKILGLYLTLSENFIFSR